MTEATVRQSRFAADVPQRELRLVVEGVSDWCASLADRRGPRRSCGFIEGPREAGQTEIVESLGSVCRQLGAGVLSLRSIRGTQSVPGRTAELARQLLVQSYAAAESGAGSSLLPSQLEQELHRLAAGLAGEAPSEPLPALEPAYQRMRLIDSLARSVLEVSGWRPLILTVENLGSTEGMLLDVLRHVLRLLARRRDSRRAPRVLLIATIETAGELSLLEDAQSEQDCLAGLTAFHVRLRGYSRDDLCGAATRLLGEPVATSTREQIMRVTDGNPRYIRWLLLDGKEAGGLDLRSPRHLTLAEIVKRRFERASERERKLLLTLALLRRPTQVRLLEMLAASLDLTAVGEGDDPIDLPDALIALEVSAWLRSGGAESGSGPSWFSICDGEIADLILGLSGRDELGGLRRALGRALTAGGVERRVDLAMIACRLFLDAGDGEEAAQQAGGVVDALRTSSCFPEALELIEAVLASAGRLPVSLEHSLREQRVQLLHAGGYYREAADGCDALLSEVSDPETMLRLRGLRAELHGEMGEEALRVRVTQQMIESLPPDEGPVRRANLLAELGHAYVAADQLDQAGMSLEVCLSILPEGSFDHAQVRRVFELAAVLHTRRGKLGRAVEVLRGLVRTAGAAERFHQGVALTRQLSELEFRLGRPRDAEEALQEALSRAQKSGSRWLVAEQLEALGRYWIECRQPSAALAYLEQACGIYLDLGNVAAVDGLRLPVLTVELELGFFDRASKSALAYAVSSADVFTGESEPVLQPRPRQKALRRFAKRARKGMENLSFEECLRWGQILEDDGSLQEACGLYREALRRSPPPEARLDLCRRLAGAALLQGDAGTALRFVEKGLGVAQDRLDRRRAALAAVAVAGVYDQRGDLSRACDSAARALRLVQDEPHAEVVLGGFLCLYEVLREAGELHAARGFVRAAAQVAESSGNVRAILEVHLRWCAIARELGDLDESAELLAYAEELANRHELPVPCCRLLLQRAWTSLARGDYEDASEAALVASNSARALRMPALLTRSLFALAAVQGASTNPRKNFLRALDLFEQALGRSRNEECPRLEWELLRALGRLHAERGSEDVAAKYELRAEEIFARCGTTSGGRGLPWGLPTGEAAVSSELEETVPAVAFGSVT